jgi:hypothetical protein
MTQAVHDEEYFPIGLIPNYPDPRLTDISRHREVYGLLDIEIKNRTFMGSIEDKWDNFWKFALVRYNPELNIGKMLLSKQDKQEFYDAYIDSFKKQWRQWWEHQELRKPHADHGAKQRGNRFHFDGWSMVDEIRRLYLKYSYKPQGDTGWESNLMILQDKPITFRGRNRIIGVYQFDDLNKVDVNGNDAICTYVYYSNGGSIKKNDLVKAALSWTG